MAEDKTNHLDLVKDFIAHNDRIRKENEKFAMDETERQQEHAKPVRDFIQRIQTVLQETAKALEQGEYDANCYSKGDCAGLRVAGHRRYPARVEFAPTHLTFMPMPDGNIDVKISREAADWVNSDPFHPDPHQIMNMAIINPKEPEALDWVTELIRLLLAQLKLLKKR